MALSSEIQKYLFLIVKIAYCILFFLMFNFPSIMFWTLTVQLLLSIHWYFIASIIFHLLYCFSFSFFKNEWTNIIIMNAGKGRWEKDSFSEQPVSYLFLSKVLSLTINERKCQPAIFFDVTTLFTFILSVVLLVFV